MWLITCKLQRHRKFKPIFCQQEKYRLWMVLGAHSPLSSLGKYRSKRLTFCQRPSFSSTSFWNTHIMLQFFYHQLLHHPQNPIFFLLLHRLTTKGLCVCPFCSPGVCQTELLHILVREFMTVLRYSMNAIRYCDKTHEANAKMGEDWSFLTTIFIFKSINIHKFRDMEKHYLLFRYRVRPQNNLQSCTKCNI